MIFTNEQYGVNKHELSFTEMIRFYYLAILFN